MFAQHKQELVPGAGNVRFGLPGKISSTEGRKQQVRTTFRSARVRVQQGLEPRTAAALLKEPQSRQQPGESFFA